MGQSSNLIAAAAAGQWNWQSVPVERIGKGIERQIIVGDQLMVCRLRFEPNIITAAHDHAHEQITLVERGRVRFTIGDDDFIARTGDVLHFPSGCRHGATILEEEVILIDIFTPVRKDFLAPGSLEQQAIALSDIEG